MQTGLCSVLCDTISDKDILLNYRGIILPMVQMALFLTFVPTAGHTINSSLPKEIQLALCSHKAPFYQGDLVLNVDFSIPAPPAFIFYIAMWTLL